MLKVSVFISLLAIACAPGRSVGPEPTSEENELLLGAPQSCEEELQRYKDFAEWVIPYCGLSFVSGPTCEAPAYDGCHGTPMHESQSACIKYHKERCRASDWE